MTRWFKILKRDLDKLASKCARISFILLPVAVCLSKTSLLETSNIGQNICDICARCLANFLVEKKQLLCFYARIHLLQTELVSVNGPHLFEYFTFTHDFRPLRANHRHKLKPLLAQLNSYKYYFFVNIVNEWNNLP